MRRLIVAAITLLAACGDPSGPIPEVSGDWVGFTSEEVRYALALTQTGTRLSGTANRGDLPFTITGTVRRDGSVEFLHESAFRFTGTLVNSTTMAGTVDDPFDGEVPLTLSKVVPQ